MGGGLDIPSSKSLQSVYQAEVSGVLRVCPDLEVRKHHSRHKLAWDKVTVIDRLELAALRLDTRVDGTTAPTALLQG
jgi:hypothetical protein